MYNVERQTLEIIGYYDKDLCFTAMRFSPKELDIVNKCLVEMAFREDPCTTELMITKLCQRYIDEKE